MSAAMMELGRRLDERTLSTLQRMTRAEVAKRARWLVPLWEDVFQDAALRAARSFDNFLEAEAQGRYNFSQFFVTHIHSALRDMSRYYRRQKRDVCLTVSLDEPQQASEGAITLGDTVGRYDCYDTGDYDPTLLPEPLCDIVAELKGEWGVLRRGWQSEAARRGGYSRQYVCKIIKARWGV